MFPTAPPPPLPPRLPLPNNSAETDFNTLFFPPEPPGDDVMADVAIDAVVATME
jgi:hypothetical protein